MVLPRYIRIFDEFHTALHNTMVEATTPEWQVTIEKLETGSRLRQHNKEKQSGKKRTAARNKDKVLAMKKLFFLIPLVVFLAACGTWQTYPVVAPVSTPNAGEIALQMLQEKAEAEATSQIVSYQFTATAQVIGATTTAQFLSTEATITQQARIDGQATSEQARRDVAETQQRIDLETAQAQTQRAFEAGATQARMDLEATQRAESTATTFSITQAVIPTHNLWTQQAVEQQIIIATNEVELSNLAVKQAQDTNSIKWQIPLLVALVVLIVGTIVILRDSRWKIIKNGDGDIVGVGHAMTYITPNLLPGPVLDLESKEIHDVTDKETQNNVTRRAQGIEALKVMPVNPTQNGATAFNHLFGEENTEDPFEVIDGDILPPAHLLDSETLKVTEKDWQDANNK